MSEKSGPTARHAQVPELPADEVQCLARIAAGDHKAFRVIVDRYLTQIAAIARRMLRNDSEAEDVAQDVFLRLWRNAAGLELGLGGHKPWLRRVTTNLCIDRMRATKRLTVVEELPEVADPATQQQSIEEREMTSRVNEALQTLPDRQRAALVLFHYEGLSLIEIGETLGVSSEAIESLLARARRQLKSQLKSEWQQLLPYDERQL